MSGFDFGTIPALDKPVYNALDERELFKARWGTELGQLWLVGKHYLLCGNSLFPESWSRLRATLSPELASEPSLLITDPPYGVKYDPSWRLGIRAATGIVRATGTVDNDDRADWREVYELSACDVAYVWHGGLHAATVADALKAAGYELRCQIIWVKQHFAMSRGNYHWQHEPCWYAVKAGAKADFVAGRDQVSTWQERNLNAFGSSGDDYRTSHSTQKPTKLMMRSVANHSHKVVYDPFLGSGTTMEACNRLDRICLGMELDPGYVGIILSRMERLGIKPSLVV